MIKSVYDNQKDLIAAIKELHGISRFDLDATYNTGTIHYGVEPVIRCDLEPLSMNIRKADCRNLDFISSRSLMSIMFDPPFLAGGGGTGKINSKYGSFSSVPEMLEMYEDSIREALRILNKRGILVVKCQDLCNGRTQTFSHCEVYTMATELGFYAKDLFILTSIKRMKPPNMRKQIHARKYHSYFWVFEKCGKNNKKWIIKEQYL